MNALTAPADRLRAAIVAWVAPRQASLAAASITLVRLSLGLVFLFFGLLKFFPGVSPAADIATQTMVTLTFGLLPPTAALLLVALLETAIGVCLLSRRWTGLGLGLLGFALVGIVSPLVLFPGELFAGPFFAPTLLGQYVIKDVVLIAAAAVLVVQTVAQPAANAAPRPAPQPATAPRRDPAPVRPALRPQLESTRPNRRVVAALVLAALVLGAMTNLALATPAVDAVTGLVTAIVNAR